MKKTLKKLGGLLLGLALVGSPLIASAAPYSVIQGGTGASTFTKGVLLGDGTNPVTSVAPGSSGNVLMSNGTTWISSVLSAGVSSVFGRSGAVTAQSGDYTTSLVTEGSNLYWTTARGLASFIANLAATSSVSSITALPNLTLPFSQLSGVPSYEVPLTFSTGLTRTTNTITVNTSQNIATLSNLTSNGFVKTGSGNGTLSVDTTAYTPQSTTLTAGNGLTGGGDLSTNRSFAIDFTRANSWTGLQNFSNATSSVFSALRAYFGATATTTIGTDGTITTPNISAAAVTLSGVTGVAGNCLHVDTNGVISGTGTDCGSAVGTVTAVNGTTNQITSSGGTTPTLSLPNLVIFPVAASSTRLSVTGNAYFGGTATSTFNSAGVLTLATPLAYNSGGTGQSSWTKGDILYSDNTNSLAKLGIGTGGFVLGVSNGLPAWVATTTLSTISGVLSNVKGGTGQDSSAWTGIASVAAGVWSAITTTGTGNVVLSASPTLTGTAGFANGTFSGTLGVTGLATFVQASSTRQSIFDKLYVGGTATTTIQGSASATSTFSGGISSTGCIQLTGGTLCGGSSGALYDYQVFTSNGTWTKPASATGNEMVVIQLWGGGGAGGGVNQSGCCQTGGSGGGGGGTFLEYQVRASDLGSTVEVTVGAVKTGTTANGGVGNDSCFSTSASCGGTVYARAYGGGGGVSGGNGNSGGAGGGGGWKGVGSAGSGTSGGAGGSPGGGSAGSDATNPYGGAGGANGGSGGATSIFGGAGGGGGSNGSNGGNGGDAWFGGAGGGGGAGANGSNPGGSGGAGKTGYGGAGGQGGTSPGCNNGSAGTAPGGGGGGGGAYNCTSPFSGGSGARGEVRIFTI